MIHNKHLYNIITGAPEHWYLVVLLLLCLLLLLLLLLLLPICCLFLVPAPAHDIVCFNAEKTVERY